MAQAIEPRSALIVAHGSPSLPDEQERAIRDLAAKVQKHLPGWRVSGATLAGCGTMEAAFDSLPSTPCIYPLFMSNGWFVNTALPRRLRACGSKGAAASCVAPLGLDRAVPNLCMTAALEACGKHRITPSDCTLILAAHGSPSDPRPRLAAERVTTYLEKRAAFRQVRAGFVDESPALADAARDAGPAVCLPFFAMYAGHVKNDVPEALEAAGFDGVRADSIGLHEKIPEIVASGLERASLSLAA